MSQCWCQECGGFIFSFEKHTCPPAWQAIREGYCDPEDESTYYKVFAEDAEAAALELAKRCFSDWEYPSDFEIWVRKAESDPWEKFEITVETVPSFSANRVTAGGVA